MYLLIRINPIEGTAVISDTDNKYCFETVSIPLLIQSSILGIKIDHRYATIFERYNGSLKSIYAGLLKYGHTEIKNWYIRLGGTLVSDENSSKRMHVSVLNGKIVPFSVISGNFSGGRESVLLPYSSSITDSDLSEFNNLFENSILGNSTQDQQYEDDDDLDLNDFFGDSDDVDTDYEDSSQDEDDEDLFFDDSEDLEMDEDLGANAQKISKLYSTLNKEQFDLLNEYIMWHSQRVFLEARGSLRLKMVRDHKYHEKKVETLAGIRGDDTWNYIGFIDTGFKGGGECDLGHPLRYVHMAQSVESGKRVRFGSKCISDFFEIDDSVQNSILRTQRELSEDLVMLADLYQSESSYINAKDSFTIFSSVLKSIVKVDTLAKTDIVIFANRFLDMGLLPTKSMVKTFKRTLYGVDDLSNIFFSNAPRTIVMKSLYGSEGSQVLGFLNTAVYHFNTQTYKDMDYVSKSFAKIFGIYLNQLFNIELDGVYKYNPVFGLHVRGEGGKSKKAKEHYTSCEGIAHKVVLYSKSSLSDTLKLLSSFISNFAEVISCYSVLDSLNDVLTTSNIDAYKSQYDDYDDVSKLISDIKFVISRKITGYCDYDLNDVVTQFSSIVSRKDLLNSFKVRFSEVCSKNISSSISDSGDNGSSAFSDLDNLSYSVLDIDKSIDILKRYINEIEKTPNYTLFKQVNSFNLEIFNSVRRYRKASTKQVVYLRKLSESIKETMAKGVHSVGGSEDTKLNELMQTCKDYLNVMSNKDLVTKLLSTYDSSRLLKTKTVVSSVLAVRHASEKQMYYINYARKVLDSISQ